MQHGAGDMAERNRKKQTIRVTVGLDSEDHSRLSRIAEDSGVSLAWVIRRATVDFLAKNPGPVSPTIARENRRNR
jgi:hypothetical protein